MWQLRGSLARPGCTLDLDGSLAYGASGQSFETVPGQLYHVSFAMAGNPDACGLRQMRVSEAGTYGEFSFDSCGRTYNEMGWTTKGWIFEAVSATTNLDFSSLGSFDAGDDGGRGPALDSVAVVPVPEPTTAPWVSPLPGETT